METPFSRASRAAVAMWSLMALAACFRPDVEALTVKLREECRVGPPGPECQVGSPAAQDYLSERWLLEEIDSAGEEQCLLGVPCGTEISNDDISDVQRCLRQDDTAFEQLFGPHPTDECIAECNNALWDCGAPDDCSVDVVEACMDERDACFESCRGP